MPVLRNRRALIGAAVALIAAAFAAAALAASSRKGHDASAHRSRPGLIQTASSYLGVPSHQLVTKLHSGQSLAQVAAATGHSEAGLIATLVATRSQRLARQQERIDAQVINLVRAHRMQTGRRPNLRRVSAAYLGVSMRELRSELRSGHSLAQIANETPGHSEAGLLAALTSATTERLSSAASSGRITPAQQAGALKSLPHLLAVFVHRVHHAR